MTTRTMRDGSTSAAWGSRLILALCVLLMLSGIWLFFAVGTAAVFEGDTGVSLRELEAAYPTVAAVMERRGQHIAILLVALGAFAFIVAWAGLRTGSPWAWYANWVLVVAVSVIAVSGLTMARWDIGLAYLFYAMLGIGGQLLTTRGLRRT